MTLRQTLLDFKEKKDAFIRSKDTNHESSSTKSDVEMSDEKTAAIQVLKTFDLDSKYGPCIGLTRLERYNRAVSLGLNPDQKIILLLETYPSDPSVTECIWNHLK